MTITDELKQKNYSIFKQKLEEVGVDVSKIDGEIKDKLINGTFALENSLGMGYEGSLLNIVLRTLTPFALKINELLPEKIRVEKNKLVKVCLLQHLSKIDMYVKTQNGFKFNPKIVALRFGARSIALANELGITFDTEEVEAILGCDKGSNDEQRWASRPITVVLRQANELIPLEAMFGK